MLPVHIYGLQDPRSNEIRYVGKTLQPLKCRLSQHIQHAKRHPTIGPKVKWIVELANLGLKPEIILFETVLGFHWQQAEIDWARKIGKTNHLFNRKTMLGAGSDRSYVLTWTPELEARLGKESDRAIAEDLGVTRKAISYRRQVSGIAASYDKSRMKPPPNMAGHNRRSFPPAIIERLGKDPDYKIAADAGVQKSVIMRLRKRMGIRSYAEQTGNRGTYKPGNFPARWLKQRSKMSA